MLNEDVCITIEEPQCSPPDVLRRTISHAQLNHSLLNAFETSRLGSGPAEPNPTDNFVLTNWFHSVPWGTVLFQAVWSTIVTVMSYFLADGSKSDTFSVTFWISELNNSSFVISAIGWGLFALLAFFIKDAFGRYREALHAWNQLQHVLRQAARQLIQMFPEGTWHRGDRERLIAHLTAYPIALKMQLREEWEPEQLQGILDEPDIEDVIESPSMHLHCSKVVRSYLTAVEDDCKYSFSASVLQSPGSDYTRNFVNRIVDKADQMAATLERIGTFQSSAGYISHLRLLMYIWFFFVPVSFVPNNGWFTIFWSTGVTYGIAMIFDIAKELNDPFGFQLRDIKLNKLAAIASLNVMSLYAREDVSLEQVLNASNFEIPPWLDADSTASDEFVECRNAQTHCLTNFFLPMVRFLKTLWSRVSKASVYRPLLLFFVWAVLSVLGSWGVTKIIPAKETDPKCRWWCTYLPPHQTTASTIGLAVFLLLGLVTADSYNRYWEGLLLWDNELRSYTAQLALHFAVTCRSGVWHPFDRERIFSHIAALPVAIKLFLRDSKDVSELDSVLSPTDLAALQSAADLPSHCFHVLYGYLNSASQPENSMFAEEFSPFRELMYTVQDATWRIEFVIQQCEALRKYPIPASLVSHLQVFMGMWLFMVPLALVDHDGFLVIIFSTGVAFSVINMLILSKELADPFRGDADDIPLDDLCLQLQQKVKEIYYETNASPMQISIVRESEYCQNKFFPQRDGNGKLSQDCKQEWRELYLKHGFLVRALKYIRAGFERWPSCSWRAMVVCILWAVVSTASSYALSLSWDQSTCKESWRCSPADVDPYLLSYTGFALFLILTFRANDSFQRYETGGKLLQELGNHLRSMSLEIVQTFPQSTFHKGDIERMIAHIVQIPLSLRDQLLGAAREGDHKTGLLSDSDYAALKLQDDSVQYCIRVVQAYFITADRTEGKSKIPTFLLKYMFRRLTRIQLLTSYTQTVKRFPLIKSFTKHQHLFTAFWLALLPLGMMSSSGFYTILWSPIISYAVLGLDNVCHLLEDPYGNDRVDLPIKCKCEEMAGNILEAVRSVNWDYTKHVSQSPCDQNGLLGCRLTDSTVVGKYVVGTFPADKKNGVSTSLESSEQLRPPRYEMDNRTFLTHVHRSVPWLSLVLVSLWTILAVIFAFATRNIGRSAKANKWIPTFGISQEIAVHFSFATFLVVSYYVQAAFARYREAGNIWRDQLGSTCHALLVQWLSLFPPGTWHDGDHQRVIAHIISLPIALKMEVRGKRDVRELKGLLSQDDIGKLHCADVMPLHCIDVIRSYFISAIAHKSSLATQYKILGSKRRSPVRREMWNLELAVQLSMFISSTDLTPAAFSLLGLLVGTWCIILPFILSEVAGWLTILLMPITAYGIFGLIHVAEEVKDPFGKDLNDFDLDQITSDLVQDLLQVYTSCEGNFTSLVRNEEAADFWLAGGQEEDDMISRRGSLHSSVHKMISDLINQWKPFMTLSMLSLPLRLVGGLTAWSFLLTLSSWVFQIRIPNKSSIDICESAWWCSPITIQSKLFKYSGFALFFLLSKRLYDSHLRYVQGLILWCEQMMGLSSLISNRIFASAKRGSWHTGDFERIAAHLAGYAISTAGELRIWSSKDTGNAEAKAKFREDLEGVMSMNDVDRVLRSQQPADHCLDVVRAYIISKEYSKQHEIARNEIKIIVRLLGELRNVGANCKEVQREPMPFGYIQHLRIFMALWLLLLPWGLIEAAGWLTPLWVLLIAFGIIGSEKWAVELTDPFGTDISDLPLDEIQEDVVLEIRENLRLFSGVQGGRVLIKPDRRGFLIIPSDKSSRRE